MGRVDNSIKNAGFGFFLQAITALLAFANRSAMIYALGIKAVAINGLFTEVIAALSMAELGIGSAIIYNLYKPLAEGDKEKIAQLMRLFKQAYTVIAVVTMVAGAALCPWIQHLVNGLDYELGYIRLVYMLFVFQCASSYLFAYKGALLHADQKSRVVAQITAVVKVLGTIFQILVLLVTHNYICYLCTFIGMGLLVNIMVAYRVDRMYPFLKNGGKIDREERNQVFSNIKNIFFKQLAGKVVDSTDNMLISTLVGTILVGYYANYLSVIGILRQFVGQAASGMTASLGNLFVSADCDHCEQVLKRLEFLFISAGMILAVGTFGSIQPFITMWVGKDFLLPMGIVVWCCINMYCSIAITPLSIAMHLMGRFDIGRNISICSAVVNLIVSIILGKTWGMVGIFMGTFSTYLIEFFAKTYYLYHLFFHKKAGKALVRGIVRFSETIALLGIEYLLLSGMDILHPLLMFLVCGFLAVCSCVILLVATSLGSDELNYCKGIVIRMLTSMGKKFLRGK